MLDQFNREISYLRISVTDRCNLRCSYCMPNCVNDFYKPSELLTIEEIVEVVKAGISFGINKIRLTGGEPLVRKDIVQIVQNIAVIDGIKDIAMTTNGIFLGEYAEKLKKAGLHRVNISLDTTHPDKYHKITKWGNINKVYQGIHAAKKAGIMPVKINAVKFPHTTEEEVLALKKFCYENDLSLRFIRQMDLVSGEFSEVEGGQGGICKICNRLRLTANGMIKPCLFGNSEFSIREMGVVKAFEKATENKPECGKSNLINHFYNIGG